MLKPQSKDFADTVARLIMAGQSGDVTAQQKIADLFHKSKEDPRIGRILKDAGNRIQRGDVEPGNNTPMELGDSLASLEGGDAGIDPKLAHAFEIIRELVVQIKALGGEPGGGVGMDAPVPGPEMEPSVGP